MSSLREPFEQRLKEEKIWRICMNKSRVQMHLAHGRSHRKLVFNNDPIVVFETAHENIEGCDNVVKRLKGTAIPFSEYGDEIQEVDNDCALKNVAIVSLLKCKDAKRHKSTGKDPSTLMSLHYHLCGVKMAIKLKDEGTLYLESSFVNVMFDPFIVK